MNDAGFGKFILGFWEKFKHRATAEELPFLRLQIFA